MVDAAGGEGGSVVTSPLERLYWFFRMIDSGGPDGTDLDFAITEDARRAADEVAAEFDDLR